MPVMPQGVPSATVYGVPLESGEEVVYYHRWEPGGMKLFWILGAILLSFTGVGIPAAIVMLIVGLRMTTTCSVVTRRRFLIVTKKVQQLRQEQVANIAKGVTRSGAVRWYELSDAARSTKLRYETKKAPGIQALLEPFLTERNVLQWTPAVQFEAVPATKA